MTRPDGIPLAPGRACPESATSCRLDYPQAEEWVHAAVIDVLLSWGVEPSDIRYEMWLDRSSRCDVAVVTPGTVLIVECKREPRFIEATARRQTRRYLATARHRWPDRDVQAMLAWGAPGDPSDISVEWVR